MPSFQDAVDDVAALDPSRFELAIRVLTDALDPGLDNSRFVGQGIDYVQSRPWVEGDNVRAIDHRVTARTGRVYVKEYESLRGTPILVAVDASRSMHVGSAQHTKFRVASAIASGLCLAGLRRGSAVGLEALGERTLRMRPTRARALVLSTLRRLQHLPPQDVEAGEGIATSLRRLPARLVTRHVVIVVSDLHGQNLAAALRRVHMEHDLIVIRPIDPSERMPPPGGLFFASEAETGRAGLRRGLPIIDVDGPLQALRTAGIDAIGLELDQSWLSKLVAFLRLRGNSAGNAR